MARRHRRGNAEAMPRLSRAERKRETKFLLSFLAPYRGRLTLALFVMLVSSGISVSFPALLGQVVDVVLPGTDEFIALLGFKFSLMEFAALIGALLLLQSLTRYVTSVSLATVSENVLASLRTKLFAHLVQLPMDFFGERRVGELASRLTADLTLIQDTFTFTVLEIMRQSIFLIGGLIFITSMSLELTGFVLLSVPLVVVIALVLGRYIRRYSTKTQDALAEAATVVEESLQAITSVKSYSNESHEVARYGEAVQRGVSLAITGAKLRSAFVSFIIFALFAGIAGVVWYGGTLVAAGTISLGELMSYLMYAIFIGGALGSFADLYGQIQRSLGASVRVRELLDEVPEQLDGSSGGSELFQSVTADNISFAYPSRKDAPALIDVSLSVDAGERVAFVGASGAGKSTMAALIQAFYRVDSGRLLFDGRDSRDVDIALVRRCVGIVPQDIALFGGSIAANIRYGKLDASDDEVREAARLANALEFIEDFPEGMATVVGERGRKLSGGQRQRIAIARAILKNPPILILDEATSSLDAQTEALIQQAMERLMERRTTIIIAHRLSTIRLCDRIYVFEKGRIVESGSHEALIADSESYYAKLCRLQFGPEATQTS